VRKAARLEQRIEKAEADLKAVEEELADPAAWANPTRTEQATARHETAKAAVEELLAQWETAQGAAETAAT
jgi:ATP-binding cassette subfamily F protein 3